MKYISRLFLMLFFVSCGPEFIRGTNLNKCPAWTQYGNKDSNGRYIFGTGSGMVPLEAENNARTGIASYFRVTLSGQKTFSRSVQENDKTSHSHFIGKVQTSSSVSKALEGVGILKRCFCDGRYWALAGLDIAATRHKLISEVNQKIEAAKFYLSRSVKGSDPLFSLGDAGMASALLRQAEDMGADLFVLGADLPQTGKLETMINQRQEELRNKVLFIVDGPEPARGLVMQSLTDSGLQVSSGAQCAGQSLRVKISLNYKRFRIQRSPPEFLWARLTFSMQVRDMKRNVTLYKFGPVQRDAAAKSVPDTFIRADYIFRTKILPEALQGLYNSLWRYPKGKMQ